MPQTLKAAWQGISENGLEHVVLKISSQGVLAQGAAVWNHSFQPFAFQYRITCDPSWTVKTVRVEVTGQEKALELFHDGEGNWRDGTGAVKRTLAGALDIDLSASPFTNTLPIRRLKLKSGQSARITAAYVNIPDLAVATDKQKYTCLAEAASYRYESLDSSYEKKIEVDDEGLVVFYPGLFRRVYKS